MNSDAALRLVADIGGTNARFALYRAGGPVEAPDTVRTRDFAAAEDAIRAFLDKKGVRPADAAIAVACPVTGDTVHFTNSPWTFSIAALQRALGLHHLYVYNDFAAIALALPWLGQEDCRKIGGGETHPGTPIALAGPGTGLGVSAAIPGRDGNWVPLASEGGHTAFAPADAREAEILDVLRRQYGRVSAERVISGPGIESLYTAITTRNGDDQTLSAADVVTHARKGDPAAAEAVAVFCRVFGGFAGDLVLTLGAWGGFYIGGGVVGKLGDLFDVAAFNARFEDKGRFRDLMAATPRWIITKDNPALLGLARDLDKRLGDS